MEFNRLHPLLKLAIVAAFPLAGLGAYQLYSAVARGEWEEALFVGITLVPLLAVIGLALRYQHIRRTHDEVLAKVKFVELFPRPRLVAEHLGRKLTFEGRQLDFKYPALFVFRAGDENTEAEEASFRHATGKSRLKEVPLLMHRQQNSYRIDAAKIPEFALGDVSLVTTTDSGTGALEASVRWSLTASFSLNRVTFMPVLARGGAGALRELSYRREAGKAGRFYDGLLAHHNHQKSEYTGGSGFGSDN